MLCHLGLIKKIRAYYRTISKYFTHVFHSNNVINDSRFIQRNLDYRNKFHKDLTFLKEICLQSLLRKLKH